MGALPLRCSNLVQRRRQHLHNSIWYEFSPSDLADKAVTIVILWQSSDPYTSRSMMPCLCCNCCQIVCMCLLFVCATCRAPPNHSDVQRDTENMAAVLGSGDDQMRQDKIIGMTGQEWLTIAPTDTGETVVGTATGRCGTTRIVDGNVAEDHWPWQAELFVKKTGRHLCGGTLVDRDHVLTAAHCFDSYDIAEVMVRLGSRSRTLPESSAQTYPIACSHVHKKYRQGANYDYDISLLRLKTAATESISARGVFFNKHVAPACLPQRREFGAGTTCVVTGWGYTSFQSLLLGRLPSELREARVPLLSTKTCRDAYGFTLTGRMICAGYMGGERRPDTCKGDSGGPLVCQSVDGRWKLWGVTSWGSNQFCSQSPTDPAPGVYTRVDKFVNWIDKKITGRCAV
ncbi:chymotrypsinogen A-like [Acanthaster planci]|uniref:Chymotrypsinogen A-like n=1 Tax=Acanthaster planci TaxID=133434 RepID=A0A8B7Y2V3_ACAPL|nr:chymotrypsinogen A-like [Acanthaster planci]